MKIFTIAAAVASCLSFSPGTSLQAQSSSQATTAAPLHSPAAAALKQDMRKLWTDHVVWTRDYIVAAVGGQPDAQARPVG